MPRRTDRAHGVRTAARDTTAFLGTGAMADAIRNFAWDSNPLGPIDSWPSALKTVVGVMLSSAFPQCLAWGPQRILIFNDAFTPILGGKPPALGRPFHVVWSEAWEIVRPIAEKAYAGEATFIEDFPIVINRSGYPEQTYFTFCYSPIRDDTGRIGGLLDTVVETTAKVRAEQSAQLVNAELAHRIRNTLAIVTGIIDQTFRCEPENRAVQATLSQRIAALGHAHEVLTQSSWSSAPIDAVIEGVIAPHRSAPGQIVASGPPLHLSAKQALTLALAIHELATNAIKYGALSISGGRVLVHWHIERSHSGDCLRLIWAESGGPAVVEPQRRGFGSRLIEHALAEDFRGQVSLNYDPQGFRCELTTQLANLGVER